VSAIPSPTERLSASFAPAVVEALLELIDERVAKTPDRLTHVSPWLSITESARYLKLSERTIEREIEWERLRSSTIGRRRLIHRDDLDALARKGGAGGESASQLHRAAEE
jgi:excisionase family DNA binding protein